MSNLYKRRPALTVLALSLLGGAGLLVAVPAFAQQSSSLPPAVAGVIFLVIGVIFLAVYIYFALALQTIAKKTNTENAWLAWIPIANLILMVNIAKKPMWWVILCFIPFVGIVMAILIWMAIAEARQKPSWWGILLIVPVVNIIVPGYLAWSD